MTTFADRLRTLRQEAGLTQTELAGNGVSPSYVSLLESGKRRPSPEVAAVLAAKLGCSTSLLLQGEPSDRERRIELELAYARLAREHGQARDAKARLVDLLADERLPMRVRDEAELLLFLCHESLGDTTEAAQVIEPLFSRTLRGESQLPLVTVGHYLTALYMFSGAHQRASVVGEQTLERLAEQGLTGTEEYFRLAATVMAAHQEMGNEIYAITWARRLLAEAEADDAPAGQAVIYWNAALLAESQGAIEQALTMCRQALAKLGEHGHAHDIARLQVAAAFVLLASERPQANEAADALERSREHLFDLGNETDLTLWEYLRSCTALLSGDLDTAEHLARAAATRSTGGHTVPDPAVAGRAHIAYGDVLVARGRVDAAREEYHLARTIMATGQGGRSLAAVWRELGDRFAMVDDQDGAQEAYASGLDAAGVRSRSRALLAAVLQAQADPQTEMSSERAASELTASP